MFIVTTSVEEVQDATRIARELIHDGRTDEAAKVVIDLLTPTHGEVPLLQDLEAGKHSLGQFRDLLEMSLTMADAVREPVLMEARLALDTEVVGSYQLAARIGEDYIANCPPKPSCRSNVTLLVRNSEGSFGITYCPCGKWGCHDSCWRYRAWEWVSDFRRLKLRWFVKTMTKKELDSEIRRREKGVHMKSEAESRQWVVARLLNRDWSLTSAAFAAGSLSSHEVRQIASRFRYRAFPAANDSYVVMSLEQLPGSRPMRTKDLEDAMRGVHDEALVAASLGKRCRRIRTSYGLSLEKIEVKTADEKPEVLAAGAGGPHSFEDLVDRLHAAGVSSSIKKSDDGRGTVMLKSGSVGVAWRVLGLMTIWKKPVMAAVIP